MCTIAEIKDFFFDKKDIPCPLTKKLVGSGYQQVSGGYIDRAKREGISVDYNNNTPSQYWHLMSYCESKDPQKTFSRSVVCGELIFWMAEVSNSVPKAELTILLDNIINNPLYVKGDRPFYDRKKWNSIIHQHCFDSINSVVCDYCTLFIEKANNWIQNHYGDGETERVDEPTPNGGDYSIAYYYDEQNRPCKKAVASLVNIVEYKKDGECVNSITAY